MIKLNTLARGVGMVLLVAASAGISGCSEKNAVVGYYNVDRLESEAVQIKALENEATVKLKEKQAEIDAVKSARIKKANENIKENEKILSEAQKNALAKAQAAAKASREAKKKQSQEKK